VQEWVIRDRNHPSVILWSIGNETGLMDTFGITPFIHKFDSRPTTGGMITNGVDVAGFNGPGEIAGVLDEFHAAHPNTPIVLTEEPHTLQTRGFYRAGTWWRLEARHRLPVICRQRDIFRRRPVV
jgi:beta-galactosidase